MTPSRISSEEDTRLLGAARALRAERIRVASGLPDAILCVNGAGTILLTTDGAERLFGYPPHALNGRNIEMLIPERFRAAHRRHLQHYHDAPRNRPMGGARGIVALAADGREFPVDITLNAYWRGNELTVTAHIRDISTEQDAVQAIRSRELNLRTAFDDSPVALLAVDEVRRVTVANRAASRLLGVDLEGAAIVELFHPDDRAALVRVIATAEIGGAGHVVDCRCLFGPGPAWWIRLRINNYEIDGRRRAVISVDDAVTDAALQDPTASVDVDPVTGLANAAHLYRFIDTLLADGAQHAIAAMSIAACQDVRTACGAVASDLLGQSIARRLAGYAPAGSLVASTDLCHFVIALPRCPLELVPARVAGAMQALRDLRFTWSGQTFTVVPELGTATITGSARLSVEAAFAALHVDCAGTASARAASASTGASRATPPAPERPPLPGDASAPELWAQPVAPLVAGANRLAMVVLRPSAPPKVRSLHANHRVTNEPPQVEIRALRRALAWFAERGAQSAMDCCLELSEETLSSPAIGERIAEAFDDAQIDPHRIIFTISEHALVGQSPGALDCMNLLRGRGCRFMLADFGAGVSSFAYLKRLPVEMIRIDSAMAGDLADGEFDQMLVKAICDLAHVLGKRVLAERVDSADVLALLTLLGVDYAQGDAVGLALPLDRFAQ